MKVLLLKDVYKLGRAGDVKKVADGYGRNFLIPQGMAVLATAGALKQAERIREHASLQRAVLNKEMSVIADKLAGVSVAFAAKASETGKLYGSITTQMIVDAVKAKLGVELTRRQVDTQPLRNLGEFKAHIRLTVDLIPEITVIVRREGEIISQPAAAPVAAPSAAQPAVAAAPAAVVEPVAEPAAVEAAPAETPTA